MTNSQDKTAVLQEADDLFKGEIFDKALEKYSKLLEQNNEDIPLLLRRSRCYFGMKDYKMSFNDAQTAYDLDPSSIQACICCGRAAMKLKQFEKSFRYFKDGLKIDSKNQTIAYDLQKLQGAIMAEHEKNLDEEPTYSAVRFCSQDPYPGDKELLQMELEILEKKYKICNLKTFPAPTPNTKPEDAAKHAAMAIRCRAGGRTDEALQECSRAVAIDPSNVLYRQLRAEVYLDQKLTQDALRDLYAIPNTSRSADVWKKGAVILQGMKLPVSAEFWYRRATKLSDNKDEESAIFFQKVRTERLYAPLTTDYPIKVDFGQFGRSIIATEDIPKDIECFTDLPVTMGESMTNNLVPGCHHCAMSMLSPTDYFGETLAKFGSAELSVIKELWPDTTPVYCKMCTRVFYCTEKCRDEAWATYHEVICPGRNPAAKTLYDLLEGKGSRPGPDGEMEDLWVGSYSPVVLARIWAKIVQDAKIMMREEGLSKPTQDQWAKAKAPFRRFIAFGSAKATDKMPDMLKIYQDTFADCGDGVQYDITEAEFNGRYYQASCNLQIFTSWVTPYQIFLTNIADRGDERAMKIFPHLKKNPKPSAFTGMFALHACLNHSCFNNVEVRDGRCQGDRPGVSVSAKRPIKKGEELMTTYIDTSMPRKLRRAWLYRSFNFWCQCQRCKFEGDDASTCTTCKAKADEGKKYPSCGKCHKAWYCSVACQTKAWKQGHKTICSAEHSQVSGLA